MKLQKYTNCLFPCFFISALLAVLPATQAWSLPVEWAPPSPAEVLQIDPGPFTPVVAASPWQQKTTLDGVDIDKNTGNIITVSRETYYTAPNGIKPKGLVVFLHGTSGSASYVKRTEEQSVVNKLLAAGYAVMATDSYKRNGENHWDESIDPGSNQDFQNIMAFRQQFLSTNGLDENTPWFAWGFSFGGASTYAMADMARQVGAPMSAIADYSGPGGPNSSFLPIPVQTPIFLSVGENDVVVKDGETSHRANDIAADLALLQATGSDVEYHLGLEKWLDPQRFMRIAGVDQALSEALFQQLVGWGVVDSNGRRLIALDEDEKEKGSNDYMDKKNDLEKVLTNEVNNLLAPLLVGTYWENTPWKLGRQINQQLSAVWAQHLLTGEFGDQQVAFFTSHATVPEPRTAWLMLSSLLLLVLQRRKTNSNHIISCG